MKRTTMSMILAGSLVTGGLISVATAQEKAEKPESRRAEMAAKHIARFDTDGDGKVSLEEWLAAGGSSRRRDLRQHRGQQAGGGAEPGDDEPGQRGQRVHGSGASLPAGRRHEGEDGR